MSTKKGKGRGQRKPSIPVISEGNINKADFGGLAARLLGIHQKQEAARSEVRGGVFEALQTNIAGVLPPIEPGTGRGATDDLWISVAQQLPDHDRMVEIWNTAIDRVEDAFFDTKESRWHSPDPCTAYMFGEITHWREKSSLVNGLGQKE